MSGGPALETWWYWQAYRTWVPYTPQQVRAIQQADGQKLPEVDLPNSSYKLVFNFHNAGPYQVSRSNINRHRNACRIPVPRRFQREELVSQTLLAISWHELLQLDMTSGHAPRLLQKEIRGEAVDSDYQLSSMRKTLEEQLGGGDYYIVLDRASPNWGNVLTTLDSCPLPKEASRSLPLEPSQLSGGIEPRATAAAPPRQPIWWYWQAWRTWVPYLPDQVQAINEAQRLNLPRVSIPGTKYDFVFNHHRCGPCQVDPTKTGVYRMATHLEADLNYSEEDLGRLLIPISFEDLLRLERYSLKGARITEEEQRRGEMDWKCQAASMEITMREQLGHDPRTFICRLPPAAPSPAPPPAPSQEPGGPALGAGVGPL